MRPAVWPKQPANSTLTPPLLLLLLLLICPDVGLSLFYSIFPLLFRFVTFLCNVTFHYISHVMHAGPSGRAF